MSDDTRKTKGGRPKKPAHKKRTTRISFHVNDAELARIEAAAERQNLRRASLLRETVLTGLDGGGGHRPIRKVNFGVADELGAIGTNLNQATRALNRLALGMRETGPQSDPVDESEVALKMDALIEVLDELSPMCRQLKRELNGEEL